MRWARFLHAGQVWEGEWVSDQLRTASGEMVAADAVQWLPPVQPSKIIGLALNYRDHAAELGLQEPPEPALFFKPPSSLVGHQAAIVYPAGVEYCHYETEVAVVMGYRCRNVSPEKALDYVRGYTIANDFTCRDFIVNTFRPPVRAKGWDTFCPLGPAIYSTDAVPNPESLEIVTRVNGEIRQQGNTRRLLRSIPDIIAYLSRFMTLEPNDVILTGTPEGISPVYPGDSIISEVQGLGQLVNPVVAEQTEGGGGHDTR